MLDLTKILNKDQIQTDELGRIVIDDMDVLEKINGAVLSHANFVLPDGACGNSNCLC